MNSRKIPITVLKRSVLKNIKNRRNSRVSSPYIGLDAGILAGKDTNSYVTINPVLKGKEYIEYGVIKSANNIAVMGGRIEGILANITMSTNFDERELKDITKRLNAACNPLDIQIMGGHTSVSDGVNRPQICITGVGTGPKEAACSLKTAKPGQDIIITKYIGMEGVNIVSDIKSEEIKARYSENFLNAARFANDDFYILNEAAVAIKHGVTAMHDLSEGGIFSALWDLCEASKVGIDVDLKKIPIKQSSVEICELFNINPYYLLSGGSLLLTADKGNEVVEALLTQGIKATVIGRTTDNNDKIIRNEDEIRFLDMPYQDEIYNIEKR